MIKEMVNSIFVFMVKYFKTIFIILLLFTILPYFITCNYIHPFFDDYIFSDLIHTHGREAFFLNYYFGWTGRYSDVFLWGLFNCKITYNNIQYILFGIFLLITLFSSFLYLIKGLLKDVTTRLQRIQIALTAFGFYLAFMPEVFSSFYWYDASYYQLGLAFFLLNVAFIVDCFKESISWKQKLIMFLLNIYIAGTSEMFVITLGLLYVVIILYQYIKNKKINFFWLLLLSVFGICSVLNIFSPGNLSRVVVSDSSNSFVFSSLRALYDFILFHISYTCFKTPFLFILLLLVPLVSKVLKSSVAINKITNVNPLYTISVTLLIFYLHNALSVYGAGYSLQGRVINFSILLFWMAILYNVMVFLNYFSNKGILGQLSFNSSTVKISLIGMAFLFTFSDNNRLLWGDLLRELPAFNTQMNERYSLIQQAKERGDTVIIVPEITSIPKLYLLGDDAKCGTYNFANDPRYLKEASGYFNISIKKKDE